MKPSEDILREGWKEYERAVNVFNSKKNQEWTEIERQNQQSGVYVYQSPPLPKQPSLEDFRYWVWESGDYAPEKGDVK